MRLAEEQDNKIDSSITIVEEQDTDKDTGTYKCLKVIYGSDFSCKTIDEIRTFAGLAKAIKQTNAIVNSNKDISIAKARNVRNA